MMNLLIECFINILEVYKDIILKGLKFKYYSLFAEDTIDIIGSFILTKETNLGNGYTLKVFCSPNSTIIAIPVYKFDKDLLITDKLPKISLNGNRILLQFD